ncbi:MAG TPA: FtsQ-type POTRA domain-containing protein [Terriglobales bacterium]|nr:FtsQ-type POTRA domain-containing protein [Terriglobales bacterium]
MRESLEDTRALDLEVEQESPFLRGQKRVSVRRGSIPKKTATRLIWISAAGVLLFFAVVASAAMYRYGEHSWRFRVESSDDIETQGLENVTRSQVLEVMGGDIGRNIFFVPLAQRQSQLEQIPWVEAASVMRFVPNRLRVTIHERTPVAFARVGSRILLIDAKGTLMELPTGGKKKYSFPVILGTNPGEPVSTRAARMRIYSEVVNQLDAEGAHYAQELSEVDLSDPDDVKIVPNDPEGDVLVHLGSANYLERYKLYMSHLKEWRRQFTKLQSVDLRYERQIVVNPDLHGDTKPLALPVSAMKAAMKAGVKPAVLITTNRTGSSQAAPAKPVATRSTNAVGPAVSKKPVKTVHQKAAKKGKAKTRALAKGKAATSTKTAVGNAAKAAAKPVNIARTAKPSPSIPKDKEQDHP